MVLTGTWSPATINTATAGTTTYTFTPTDACATTASITVVITALVTPTFDPVGPFCQNSTPTALPLISNNGINGTWSPATINTATAGTTTYTFTPTDACATTASITVTVTTLVTPTFDPIDHFVRTVLLLHYLLLLLMVLLVHGVLQRSILLLPVPLLIHLHQLMHVQQLLPSLL